MEDPELKHYCPNCSKWWDCFQECDYSTQAQCNDCEVKEWEAEDDKPDEEDTPPAPPGSDGWW